MEDKEKQKLRSRKHYLKNSEAMKLRARKFYYDNKERILIERKKYSIENRDIISIKSREYNETHRKERSTYVKNKKITDIQYRLRIALRGRLGSAIRDNAKSGSAVQDLGCTINELKFYLEGMFKAGMCWDNWDISGWHIDHILPLSMFDLTDREQFLKACHYTNLQPMWAVENLKKANKIINYV